jgi:hypothetical protein
VEGNGRRLSWIAIGLAGLALIVAMGRGGHTQRIERSAPYGYNGAPGDYYVPQPGVPQQSVPAPQQRVPGPQVAPGFREERFEGWRGHRPGFERGGHFGGFFRWPFFIIGGLFRLLLLGLMIWLVLKFLGRRRGGPPSTGYQPPTQGGQDPEKPPYTSETQNL